MLKSLLNSFLRDIMSTECTLWTLHLKKKKKSMYQLCQMQPPPNQPTDKQKQVTDSATQSDLIRLNAAYRVWKALSVPVSTDKLEMNHYVIF